MSCADVLLKAAVGVALDEVAEGRTIEFEDRRRHRRDERGGARFTGEGDASPRASFLRARRPSALASCG